MNDLGIDLHESTWRLLSIVLLILIVSSAISFLLRKTLGKDQNRVLFENIRDRIKAWWVMCAILALAIIGGKFAATALFAILSILAVREIARLVDLDPEDRKALIWIYIIVIPVQYGLVAIEWYNLFAVFIPVYVFLFIPFRLVCTGKTEKFFERIAKLQFTVMAGVYLLSHAPLLTTLEIPGYETKVHLLFFVLLISQLGDVLQFVWGKLFGKRKLAPLISPGKTLEGFLGGGISIVGFGALLAPAMPFPLWWSVGFSLLIFLMAVAGGLIMSAIKRDSGKKDWGELVKGHGGIMDRLDSVVFSAPIFYHLVRFYFTP